MEIETITSLQNLLGIGIVGGMVTLIVDAVKAKLGARPNVVKAVTIGFSLLFGTAYVLIRDTSWFPTIVSVLASATTIWAFFLKKSDK